MRLIRYWAAQVSSLRRERAMRADVEREFAFHIEMETQAHIEAGMAPAEASRRARLSFGGTERYREEMRDGWLGRIVVDAAADARVALRGLRHARLFTFASVATLGIGLGGAAAVFSVTRSVLEPLPYDESERIVRIFERNSATNRWNLSVADFLGILAWQHSFSWVALVRTGEVALSGRGEPVWVRAGHGTVGLFETFGVRVARGRGYLPSDTLPAAMPVVVLSDALARGHFGDADAVGRTIVLDRVAHGVIGVLPRDLSALGGIRADVWPLLRPETPTRRGPFGHIGFARLRPGVTLEAATVDLASVSERLFPIHAASFTDRTATLTPYALRAVMLGNAPRSLAALQAAVLLVLLIALANVTNLVLVRASGRNQEMVLRVALGAGRRRLARFMLVENVLLAGLGGALALAFAAVALRVLQAVGPAMHGLDAAELNAPTVALVLVLALGCGVLMALPPLAATSARRIGGVLRGGARHVSVSAGTRVFQDGLVVAEFALALPLLAAAALLLHTFAELRRIDVGVDADNVVAMRVSLPASHYALAGDRAEFWSEALREVAEAPGVASAGVTTFLPPDNGGDMNNFDLVDRPVPAGTAEPVAPWASVTPGFFEALRVPLLAGRTFAARDYMPDAPPVLLVSRAWAERYYPRESPLGRQLIEGGCRDCPRSTIVGVVGDIKYSGLTASSEGVYTPYAQWPRALVYVVARTKGDPREVLDAMRARIHVIDPELPLDDAQRLADRLSEAIAVPRDWTLLVGGFACVALVLAALGIFGVMSYVVTQQQRDIGVRLALGAAPHAMLGLVLRRGLKLAVAGTLLGVLAALQANRLLEHVLYGVRATDARTIGAVAVVLLGVAAMACWLPARRAASIDPVQVMNE